MKTTAAGQDTESLISIVDDEPCIRQSLSRFIRSAGYRTKEYCSAEDFLMWDWLDKAACVILDIRLPVMGGLELQRYMADQQPARPIVFMSGQATENEQFWAMMKGAVAFLRKPFSDDSLLKAVRKALARKPEEAHATQPPGRICPLCHESGKVTEVPCHLALDHVDLRSPAVEMIKILHPAWSEKAGLCYYCWEFYVGLGRTVSFLRSSASNLGDHSVD